MENKKSVLQKYIAQSGFCSRRQAEEFIRSGKVEVNGTVAELGVRVCDDDEVKVNNSLIKPSKQKTYIVVNKPRDYVCTNRKFLGEKNIFELLSADMDDASSLHVAGRLDKNSHGLVLLTNDGDLTERLTHPRYEHEKEYVVRLKTEGERPNTPLIIKKFIQGIDISEGDGIVRAKKIESLQDGNFRIILTEGKNRQIRRMFESLQYKVSDLQRVRIGELRLVGLGEGRWRSLNEVEIDKLKNIK